MTSSQSTRRRIVVGVDGSAASIDALKWARLVGTSLDADIEAIMTWEYPVNYGMPVVPVDWNPAGDAQLALASAVHDAFGDAPPAGLSTSVVEGHPAKILVDAGAGAEMLVVGSRGHGGFVGLLIGSTSAHCAEHAECPVLVVHGKPAPTNDAVGDAQTAVSG